MIHTSSSITMNTYKSHHMKNLDCLIALALTLITIFSDAQSNIGINTQAPVRDLEVYGSDDVHARIHTNVNVGGLSELELLLGGNMSNARDYKLVNDGGTFKLMTGIDNFATEGEEWWRINAAGETGMGTPTPTARLHIDGGEEASNTGDGYMMIGAKTSTNMIMDPNEILCRNNGASNSITIQSNGGNTVIGDGGGNTFIGDGGGNLGIGTSSATSKMTIEDDGFQISIQNPSPGGNTWHIGASNTSWTSSDNQLLFSPDQTSDAAVLRLLDVTENGGTVAPVIIRSGATQTLLLDGNEIDTKDEPLYINHNSNQDTYINPSGGRVGIGTTSPSTTCQIKTQGDEYALRIQRGTAAWDINPLPAFDYLGFVKDGWTVAHIDGASGQWITISDKRLKENIQPLPELLDKINKLNVYTYSFRHNPAHTMQIGLIAQELEKEFPEIVNSTDDQYTVAYSKLSVLILKALQEQDEEIIALENEMNALLNQIEK